MQIVEVLLVLAALVAALIGLVSLSQATAGVGGIAVACFLGILARLAQAAYHNDQLRKTIQQANAGTGALHDRNAGAQAEDRGTPAPAA